MKPFSKLHVKSQLAAAIRHLGFPADLSSYMALRERLEISEIEEFNGKLIGPCDVINLLVCQFIV